MQQIFAFNKLYAKNLRYKTDNVQISELLNTSLQQKGPIYYI